MLLTGLRAGAGAWCRVAFLFLVCFLMPGSVVHAAPLAAPANATTATWTDNILTAAPTPPTTTVAPPTPSGSTPTAAPLLPANASAPAPYATRPNVSAAPTGSPSSGGSSDTNSVIFAILGIVVGQIVGFVLIALMRHYYHLRRRRGSCGVRVASVPPDMDSNGHARLVLMDPKQQQHQQQQQQQQQQYQLADAPSGADGNGLRSTKEAPVDGEDDPRVAAGPVVPHSAHGATSDGTWERHGALVALASPLVQRFEPMDSSMQDSP